MAKMIKTVCVAVLASVVSACVPFPHNEYLAPKISGTLYNGAAPLGQTAIYLSTSATDECEKPYLVGKTDKSGQFEIGPVKETEYFVFLMGDPSVWWSLCLESGGNRQVIMRQGGIGLPPSKLYVKCDVSRKQDVYIEAFGEISGKCEAIAP